MSDIERDPHWVGGHSDREKRLFTLTLACARFITKLSRRKGDLSKMASVGAPSVAYGVPIGMQGRHPTLHGPICDVRLDP